MQCNNKQVLFTTQESHNTAVTQLAFNQTQPDLFNLVASTGSDQAAVYDDTHVGEYVGLVVQYTNAKTAHCKGGVRYSSVFSPQ